MVSKRCFSKQAYIGNSNGNQMRNLHRSDAQSKCLRFHRWYAIGLGNDRGDRILVRSRIRNRCNRDNSELGLLTSIAATNPGRPDNFTSNVGGRGYHSKCHKWKSYYRRWPHIGLLGMGESGRQGDGEMHRRRTNEIIRIFDPEKRSVQAKLRSRTTSLSDLLDVQPPFNL